MIYESEMTVGTMEAETKYGAKAIFVGVVRCADGKENTRLSTVKSGIRDWLDGENHTNHRKDLITITLPATSEK